MVKTCLSVLAATLVVFLSLTASAQGLRGGGRHVELSGRFQTTVADHFDAGFSVDEHSLITERGVRYVLQFDSPDEVPSPGSYIEITGRRRGDTVAVETVALMGQPAGGNPTIGEQRILFLLINFQNDTTENTTTGQVAQVVFDPDSSADVYWREASFEKMWITGDVFGWYTLPINNDCDPWLWLEKAIEAADDDVNFLDYNRVMLLMPEAGGCGWGGLGTLGAGDFDTDDGNWHTTVSWCRSEYYNDLGLAIMITTHEGGHNLGQHHARAIRFGDGALGGFDCEACGVTDISEYGDRYDTLGSWNLGMYNTEHKLQLNWFNEGNVIDVNQGGTFVLDPFEANTEEPKVLRIFRGRGPNTNANEWLFAEWRQPIGYDQFVNYFDFVQFDGLLMHYDWSEGGTATHLLDMTPGDGEWLNGPLVVGQTWSDEWTDLSIETVGIADGRITVLVRFAAELADLTMVRGSLESGGVNQLDRSDDVYATTRSVFGFTALEPNVMEMIVGAETLHATPETLSVTIESKIDHPDGAATVKVRNWATNGFDQVGSYRVDTIESIETMAGIDATDHVEGGTGRVEVAVKHVVAAVFSAAGFVSTFDQVEVEVH